MNHLQQYDKRVTYVYDINALSRSNLNARNTIPGMGA